MAHPEPPRPSPPIEGPDHYTHGSVNVQINYWKAQARSAWSRIRDLEEELAVLKSRATP
jgi:hypothetical protein